jgi:hypothetical protein
MTKKYLKKVVDTMEPWFAKAPSLPKNWKDGLVTAMPWIALIFGALGVYDGVLGLRNISFTVYAGGFIASLIFFVSAILLLAAYSGLKKRSYKGWELLFASELVSLVGGIILFSGIIMTLVFSAIGFYLIFQIKSHYK